MTEICADSKGVGFENEKKVVCQVTNSCRGWRSVDLYVETTKIVDSWWIRRDIFAGTETAWFYT